MGGDFAVIADARDSLDHCFGILVDGKDFGALAGEQDRGGTFLPQPGPMQPAPVMSATFPSTRPGIGSSDPVDEPRMVMEPRSMRQRTGSNWAAVNRGMGSPHRAFSAIVTAKSTGRPSMLRLIAAGPRDCDRIAIRRRRTGAADLSDAHGAAHSAVRSRQRDRCHGAAFGGPVERALGQARVVENRPGGDGLVSIKAFIDAHDDHTLYFGPAGAFLVHLYDPDRSAPPYDLSDIVPIAQVYVTVLAISVPTSLHIDTMDQLVALARAEPGKLNVAAATGNSDFLIYGFFKQMGLQIVKVPYRDIMQAPNDLAENRIQVMSTSLAVTQPMMQAAGNQGPAGLEQAARARRAGHPDRGRGRLSGADHGDRWRRVRTERHAGSVARTHRRRFPRRRRQRSGHWQAAGRHRPDHDTARPGGLRQEYPEQNDQLAGIAKVLGLKAAQ